MGKQFKHLTWTDRIRIEAFTKAGYSPREIGKELNKDRTTIIRELQRGTYLHTNYMLEDKKRYSPDIAQEKYNINLKEKGRGLKIGNDFKLLLYIEELVIDKKMSPYAALETLKKENRLTTNISLSTVYNYIRNGVFPNLKMENCPAPRKKRKQKVTYIKKTPRGTSIEQRPEIVNQRVEEGHWEMDTVVGGRGSKNSLLVLTEKKSMLEIIEPLREHTAEAVVKTLDRLERNMGSKSFRNTFKTITVDNGVEFSDWKGMERSKRNIKNRTKIYVCHPYSSWERANNESNNKFIRRFIIKGDNFDGISKKEIKNIEAYINEYPRRSFGGKSSREMSTLLV